MQEVTNTTAIFIFFINIIKLKNNHNLPYHKKHVFKYILKYFVSPYDICFVFG